MVESNIKKIIELFRLETYNDQVKIIDYPEFRMKKWYQAIKK